jgi:polyisoprenoid-binding protein YceI
LSRRTDETVQRQGPRSRDLPDADKETIMQAPSGQLTPSPLQALLDDGALAGEWVLDPRKSSIRLKSRTMWGLARVDGLFREVSGNGTVCADGAISGTVTVAAASVDTQNNRRDTHLRSADFFDSSRSPDIVFTADGIRPSGQGVTVTGTLTVRGCTRPLSVDAAASVQGDAEVLLDAEARINRADFGLTWNPMGIVGVNNILTIHAVFTRR